MVETSSAELIQGWNPGAKVVKWSLPTAYYIDEPSELGRPPTNWIAADDRASKEKVAAIATEIGQDPIDAGPLRMSRALEAQVLLFMVPLYQRRAEHWENTVSRSSFWSCHWQDDWSEPVVDSGNLAKFPQPETPQSLAHSTLDADQLGQVECSTAKCADTRSQTSLEAIEIAISYRLSLHLESLSHRLV
jgi:hypothetical protein